MHLFSFFDADPPAWQTWVIPAAGLSVALLSLVVGRFLLANVRHRPKAAGAPKATGDPAHDPFDYGSVTERRSSARRKGNPIEVLVSDADGTAEPVRGWVLDRSMGGMCLLLNGESPVGSVLSIKPRSGPAATPWVQLEVRTCKKELTGYETGCQFVRTPPWAVLLLFG